MPGLLIKVVLVLVAAAFLYLASAFRTQESARNAAARLFLRHQHHRAGIGVLGVALLMFSAGEAWKAFFGGSTAWTVWMTLARLMLPVGALLLAYSVAKPRRSRYF